MSGGRRGGVKDREGVDAVAPPAVPSFMLEVTVRAWLPIACLQLALLAAACGDNLGPRGYRADAAPGVDAAPDDGGSTGEIRPGP
jgi:hypothetical protein